MTDLRVCEKCGWHEHGPRSEDQCWPEAGAAADRLIQEIGIPATKLGYGVHRLTFVFDEDSYLTLQVNKDGSFEVDHIFWLGQSEGESMAILVKALAGAAKAWREMTL